MRRNALTDTGRIELKVMKYRRQHWVYHASKMEKTRNEDDSLASCCAMYSGI